MKLLGDGKTKEVALEEVSKYKNIYIINKLISLLNRFYFVEDNNMLISILDTERTQICVEAFDNYGNTSGAVSFMDLYSMVTGLIGQNGRRK